MSQTLLPLGALSLVIAGIGFGPYYSRRLFESEFRDKQKPDYFRYGLLMRDYAVSDTIREQLEPTNGTIKRPNKKVTSNPFKAELEEQMDRLILEVALKDVKQQ
ncbi:hypothetical protein ABK040_007766 [Willaertia magna]